MKPGEIRSLSKNIFGYIIEVDAHATKIIWRDWNFSSIHPDGLFFRSSIYSNIFSD